MTRADFEGDEPEEIKFDETMLESWAVFTSMLTQWRSAGAGAYGLDYNVLPMMFELHGVKDKEVTFGDIRIMEAKALEVMAHNNK